MVSEVTYQDNWIPESNFRPSKLGMNVPLELRLAMKVTPKITKLLLRNNDSNG